MESTLVSTLTQTPLRYMINQYNKTEKWKAKRKHDPSQDALLHLSCISKAIFHATYHTITELYQLNVYRIPPDFGNISAPRRRYKHFWSEFPNYNQNPSTREWLRQAGYHSAESVMLPK